MKTTLEPIKTIQKSKSSNLESLVRRMCLEANEAIEAASNKCILAGHLLNALKERALHGEFMALIGRVVPEISYETASIWMRAARNVANALPAPPSIDIDVDAEVTPWGLLTMPEAELSDAAREWKQGWFSFMEDKTIKDCLAGVFVNGDPEHRIDRAINGKMHGGAGGDRKDFPLFVGVKLRDMGSHFSHWTSMTEMQRTEAKEAVVAAIVGDTWMPRGREIKKPFNYAAWPEEICRVAMEALKERLKK